MTRWLKRFAIALGVIAAIPVLLVAGLVLFGTADQRFGLVMILTAITANHSPPRIAETGVVQKGKDWMTPEPASSRFTAILRKNFPMGSNIQAMQTALEAQGFESDKAVANALRYDWGGPVCNRSLIVTWTADHKNHLTGINGSYGAACL